MRPPRADQDAPNWDGWIASGLVCILAGVWLLRFNDPFLLTLWGIGLLIIGIVTVITGAGLALRFWR